MLNPQTLVVVADGTSAIFWLNRGHGINLDHVETLAMSDIVNDGPSGVTPPEQSVKDTEEATFVKHLVNKLNAMALDNAIKGDVVIIADPTSLGQMRPQFHSELSKCIVREISKTLVNSAKEDIEKALA